MDEAAKKIEETNLETKKESIIEKTVEKSKSFLQNHWKKGAILIAVVAAVVGGYLYLKKNGTDEGESSDKL